MIKVTTKEEEEYIVLFLSNKKDESKPINEH
jgi:hypothetical protein